MMSENMSHDEIIESARDHASGMISEYEKYKDDKEYLKVDYCDDEGYICVYYGDILYLNPSGKFYTCWTTNQTDDDVENDQLFWDTINEIIEPLGLWVETGEGNACDVMICGEYVEPEPHFCKNCKWIDEEEYNLRLEICRCYKPQNIVQRNNILKFDHVGKKSMACFYYVERTPENKDDYKETSEYKGGCYL